MLRQRKPTRLRGYDYSQNGEYFITICTKNRENLFGDVVDGKMILNEYGEIVKNVIQSVGTGLAPVRISKHQMMPNHVHLIVELWNSDAQGQGQALSLPDIVREIKSKASVCILDICKIQNTTMGKIWQRSYHDHIIRNEQDHNRICEYIQNNPLQWELDCHNPISDQYKDWSDHKR